MVGVLSYGSVRPSREVVAVGLRLESRVDETKLRYRFAAKGRAHDKATPHLDMSILWSFVVLSNVRSVLMCSARMFTISATSD